MRVIVLVKASKDSEAGVMPSERLLTEMTAFNEELAEAGVMLAGEGLTPSSRGARVRFSNVGLDVVQGPFEEAEQLVAGYWLWEVDSLEDAIEWVKRVPNPDGIHGEIEIRPIFEAEEFGEAFTPELREKDARLRAQTGARG
jgi:hypothetical protein